MFKKKVDLFISDKCTLKLNTLHNRQYRKVLATALLLFLEGSEDNYDSI